MHRHLLLFLVTFIVLSCDKQKEIPTKEITAQFYEVYREREDFEQFLSFYAEKAILEDFISGDRIEGKENLKAFFDWSNPSFKKLGTGALVVQETVVDKKKAVVKGYFTPFKWGEFTSEAMHFTTILEFNGAGKIIRHQDWINYPNTILDYSKRKNSNEWLN